MMKAEILEYYPNGNLKHIINFYPNDKILVEYFYSQNEKYHNTCGPAIKFFNENGKINWKYYHLKERFLYYVKLEWQNKIKNI